MTYLLINTRMAVSLGDEQVAHVVTANKARVGFNTNVVETHELSFLSAAAATPAGTTATVTSWLTETHQVSLSRSNISTSIHI